MIRLIFCLPFRASVQERMVCGNMDVEVVPGSYMDDLYDSTEEKVTSLRYIFH